MLRPSANLRRRGALLVLAALLTALIPGAARADWLITREGARVETKGAWKVKGKLVVFQTLDGNLSSLRVAEVDLDASRRATEEAVAADAQAAAEPEKSPERRKSVRVITDKDVQSAAPAEQAEGEAAPESPVTVEAWNQASDQKTLLISGTLKNGSTSLQADVKVKVLLLDEKGGLIATSQAALLKDALPPGQRTEFRAEFPGIAAFAKAKFETASRRATLPAPPEDRDGG